ncbi:MAG TPA: hypothetical protein VMY98_06335, partial [Anaerolineae bacterium]|nr:hypothetical protein [Anaerolineae bacterium]
MQRFISVIDEYIRFATGKVSARTLFTVLGAYVVLTVVFTHPVTANILTQPAGSTDVYEYMWELWWAKRSIVDLHISPASVTALYYPYGAHHPLLLLDAYLMLTSLPLVILFSPAAAINLHLLSSYALTGFTTYLLCYSLTRRHWPAFIGGAVFAFSPFRADRAAHGVISMALTYWLPLYVLFLMRLFERPRMRNAIFCGIALGFSILSSFLHLAHFVVPFTLVFLAYHHFAGRRRLYSLPFLKCAVVAAGLACLMILPAYVPLLKARLAGELEYFSRFGVLSHSAALLGFVVPPSFQLIVRQFEPLRTFLQELLPGRYYMVYLGLVSVLLAMVGLVSRKARLWGIVALVSAVLALGPFLHVTRDLAEVTVADRTGYVLLPGAMLTRLPFYEWARGPARFAELTVFSIAILASYGVRTAYRLRWSRVARVSTLCTLLVLLLADYALFVPFPTQDLSVPAFYSEVQGDAGDYGILDLGTERFNHEGMYFQTVHQHPLARGFIYRYPSGSHYYQQYLEQLASPEEDIVNSGQFVPILRQMGIRSVVLHKLSETTVEGLRPVLSQDLGEAVYEDEQIVAYEVPGEAATSDKALPLLMLGDQWHPIESVDGIATRWMVNDATFFVRVQRDGAYQLAFVAHPFREPRHLHTYVNENLIAEYHVGGMQSYLTPAFTLDAGEWTPIRFH